MLKNSKKGFTLIELLVVIAIIGILSSVVLASLNSARNKGGDAAVKSNLANARPQAEIFYDDTAGGNGTYTNLCANTTIVGQFAAAKNAGKAAGAACNSSASQWAMSVQLKSSTNYWCTDYRGVATSSATALGALTRCP